MNQTTEQMERASQGFLQMYEEMNSFTRESMDVALRAAAVLSKGWDETMRNTGSLVQENMARALSAGKTCMQARNPKEFMDAQSDFLRECMESFMSNSGKLTEISARTTKEAMEPVAQQANSAFAKMTDKAKRAA